MLCIDLKLFADHKQNDRHGEWGASVLWEGDDFLWQAHRITVMVLYKLTYHFQQHLPLLQAFSLKISPLQDGLGSRALFSPGTDPARGTGGFHGRSQVLKYKMAIFFFHNSMLLHYQILS